MNRPTCYHCDDKPARTGSVFCEECAPKEPEPTAQECAEAMHGYPMPAIIHERTEHPRPPEGFRAFLARLFAPYRHAANLAARFEALYRELQDTAQSNLALRRKCADLKAQRDALLAESEHNADREELAVDLAAARTELVEWTSRALDRGLELSAWQSGWKAYRQTAPDTEERGRAFTMMDNLYAKHA